MYKKERKSGMRSKVYTAEEKYAYINISQLHKTWFTAYFWQIIPPLVLQIS